MREKGQTEAVKTLETPVFSRGIEILTEKLKFANGSMIAIDTIAVENEVADNLYQRSELDYLIYNDPIGYTNLILNGDPVKYLKTITVYKPFEN